MLDMRPSSHGDHAGAGTDTLDRMTSSGPSPAEPTVLQTFPLGFQWPTADPFLFCVHHLDRYPSGTAQLGPVGSLAGRDIGQDFEGIDGWRMYHGDTVPGFPQHPHRGFETVTFVRRGLVDHSDSLGAGARYGRGDVQWLTAGRGIVHAEMFPLLDRNGPNTLELFQIWVNLPAADKMADPYFSMLWAEEIPVVEHRDGFGRRATVTVVAGSLEGTEPPSPPPASWASRADSDVAIWHVQLDPGATWTMPAARRLDSVRLLYVFDGVDAVVGDHRLERSTGAVVDPTRDVAVHSDGGAEILVLQGRPIGEPVARYGPFVMNDREEIETAFADYRRTQFGGWPWHRHDPVHGSEPDRFARRPDGSIESPDGAVV